VLVKSDTILYFLIRFASYPFRWMPYSWIRKIGKWCGIFCFYSMSQFRKKTLSNLALAADLKLSTSSSIQIAKESFQNLAIICLEYAKLDAEKNLSSTIRCENPEIAAALHAQGKGIIFFCGHQANWEVLFLEGTQRMKGMAIGKPLPNKKLYHWILSIREKYGGKIIAPRNAVAQSLRALREGTFLGIVGDQAMPSSGYSFPFLGRTAWSSTAPALLSHKTNSPIIFVSTKRTADGYLIHYSDPLWPNLSEPVEKEVVRIMDQLLKELSESIKKNPGEWLWQHNRWKQQTPKNIYKRFRHDALCIILPREEELFYLLYHALPAFKEIYPTDFLLLIIPSSFGHLNFIEAHQMIYYTELKETLIEDWRPKLIFNFTNYRPLERHFKRLSAIEVLDLSALKKLARPHLTNMIKDDLPQVFKRALCRPGSLWQKE
jgi:KDO2-lipid IV(A) lauroyltransferase